MAGGARRGAEARSAVGRRPIWLKSELAHILYHRGRRDAEVMEMAEVAAKGLERTARPRPPRHLDQLNNLAVVYQDAGKLPEAIALFERLRDARSPSSDPTTPAP